MKTCIVRPREKHFVQYLHSQWKKILYRFRKVCDLSKHKFILCPYSSSCLFQTYWNICCTLVSFCFFSKVETQFTVVWKTTVTIKFLYLVFPVWELWEPCWERKAWDLALKWNKRGSGMSEIHPWSSSPSGGSGRHGVQASLHTACLALLSLSWAWKLLFGFLKWMSLIRTRIKWMFQLSFASGSNQISVHNKWQNY